MDLQTSIVIDSITGTFFAARNAYIVDTMDLSHEEHELVDEGTTLARQEIAHKKGMHLRNHFIDRTAPEEMAEFYDTIEKMRLYGGNFVRHLADTMTAADAHNRKKLIDAFSDVMNRYKLLSK